MNAVQIIIGGLLLVGGAGMLDKARETGKGWATAVVISIIGLALIASGALGCTSSSGSDCSSWRNRAGSPTKNATN